MGLSEFSAKQGMQGGAVNTLLHGYDLPEDTSGCVALVTAIRRAPDGFRSPFILGIQIAYPIQRDLMKYKVEWPLNMTNTKRLASLVGDDLQRAVGKLLKIVKYPTENPQTGEATWGLKIAAAKDKPADFQMPEIPAVDVPVSDAAEEDLPF